MSTAAPAAAPHLGDVVDLARLDAHVAAGDIAVGHHPHLPLRIYNYSRSFQYKGCWDAVTRTCRGLIVDADDRVVSRPFEKFFNVGEPHVTLPADRPFDVFDKLDGSLGIAYRFGDRVGVATRGSFQSAQALLATRLWQERYRDVDIPDGTTLLFEIISPENRIVVDYGEREDIVLLAAIDTATGADLAVPDDWPGPVVDRYDGVGDFDELVARASSDDWANREGFVVRFAPSHPGAPSLRVKVKFAEYVRLHRILTNVNAVTVWEQAGIERLVDLPDTLVARALGMSVDAVGRARAAGASPLEVLLEHVPDEFDAWVRATVADLDTRFEQLDAAVRRRFAALPAADRRAQAAQLAGDPLRHAVFRLLDGRPYHDLLWKMIRPEQPTRFAGAD